jgi:hypothetical protein
MVNQNLQRINQLEVKEKEEERRRQQVPHPNTTLL